MCWSEELADQRAAEPRMVVRRSDGQTATIRRVLDAEDLARHGAAELDEAPKDSMWGVQWDQSEVFAWLKEGQASYRVEVVSVDGLGNIADWSETVGTLEDAYACVEANTRPGDRWTVLRVGVPRADRILCGPVEVLDEGVRE